MTHYLYLVTRIDGKRYVGVSNDPHKRLREHLDGRGNKHLKGAEIKDLTLLNAGAEADMYRFEHEAIKDLQPELNIAPGGMGGNTGCSPKGEQHGNCKLTESDVLAIRASKETQSKLAEIYGVVRQTISDIQNGRSWSHVGGLIAKKMQPTTITEELVTSMKALRSQKWGYGKIAKKLGISPATVLKYAGGE